MFTEKRARLVKHYDEDARFCKVEGAVNNYQRKLDAESLTRIYEARDAEVGPARDLAQVAVNELEKHLIQRSSVILQHTTLLSQILELSFDDIPGVFYFTGGGMAKSPQLPSDAYWVGNNFNLSHVSPKLCHTLIYFKNTDQEFFYKTLGFAYVTSNHGITQGASRQNMLRDFGYASEIFEYHYETQIFKHIRQQAEYGIYETLSQALNNHYGLICQANYYMHSVAPSNYESNNILLFDGEKIYPYPGKHPTAICAQYFDLSRVDPDVRRKIIYFFPGHQSLLYKDYGFAYLVSPSVTTPGATRAEMIAMYGSSVFGTYYAHQVWRTYDIQYPQKWALEMAQVDYDWAIEKARYDAKHKKHMAIVRNITGIGLGALASTLVPGFGSAILTNLARGAVFGATSSAINKGNIIKGTFEGAFFSGLGGMLEKTLSSINCLKEADKLRQALKIAAIASVSANMHDENVLKSMLIAVGTDIVMSGFVGEGLTREEALAKAFGTSVVASLLGGKNLGNALMAGAIGAIGELSKQTGENLGNDIQNTIQENVVEKPKRLAITDGSNDDKLDSNNEHNLVLTQNTRTQNPNPQSPNKQQNYAEKLKKIDEFFGAEVKNPGDIADMADNILTGRNYHVMDTEMNITQSEKGLFFIAKNKIDKVLKESHRLMDEADSRREDFYRQNPQLRQYDGEYQRGIQSFKQIVPKDSEGLAIRALNLTALSNSGKIIDGGKKVIQFSRNVNKAIENFYKQDPFSEVELVKASLKKLNQNSKFKLASRVEQQLQDVRLGSLAGKLDIDKLNNIANNRNAQFLYDAATGNINVVQNIDNVLLRITVSRDNFKIISIGPLRERNLINSIENGRFIPIGNSEDQLLKINSFGIINK